MIKSFPHKRKDSSVKVWNVKSSGKDSGLILISIILTISSSVRNSSGSQNLITAVVNSGQRRDRKEVVNINLFNVP